MRRRKLIPLPKGKHNYVIESVVFKKSTTRRPATITITGHKIIAHKRHTKS